MSAFVPSTYQAAIFRWVLDTSGKPTLVVEALAGTGKTSTAVEAVFQLNWSKRIALLAFSKEIQLELTKRFEDRLGRELGHKDPFIKTVHGLGFAAIMFALRGQKGRVELVNTKYRDEVKRWKSEYDKTGSGFAGFVLTSSEHRALGDSWSEWVGALLSLFNISRLDLADFTDSARVSALARKHSFDIDPELWDLTMRALQQLVAYGRGAKLMIDFTDMLWIPIIENYRPRQFDIIFVDECQDLSRAQLELALRARAAGGRMIFIGDRNQAIYGFAGADSGSFDAILRRTNADVLSLPICYRCPTSVLDLAREYCPQIEARENAPEGIVREIERGQFCAQVDDGDMVLCRLTAPLIGACFELLANGIPAVVRGREIAEGLVAIIEKIGESWQFEEFGEGVASWLADRTAYARRRHEDEDRAQAEIDQVSDQAECLRIIWARAGARPNPSFASMIADLRAMFSDKTRATVVLSTIHRAKGLENPRVFVLHPDRIRSPRARAAWQLEQEYNLAYVCLTRAQQELVFVEEPAKRAA